MVFLIVANLYGMRLSAVGSRRIADSAFMITMSRGRSIHDNESGFRASILSIAPFLVIAPPTLYQMHIDRMNTSMDASSSENRSDALVSRCPLATSSATENWFLCCLPQSSSYFCSHKVKLRFYCTLHSKGTLNAHSSASASPDAFGALVPLFAGFDAFVTPLACGLPL